MNILSLPDEVLLLIIELLNDTKARPSVWPTWNRSPSPLLSLNLVCHRMNTLTESHLYKRLHIAFHRVDLSEQEANWTPFDRLFNSLTARPHRYTYIESLILGLFANFSSDRKVQSLLRLLEESPKLRTIALECNRDALHNTSLVEPLLLRKVCSLEIATADVEDITKSDILQNLKSLSITDAIQPDAGEHDESWWKDYKLPLERRGISPLQYLAITSYESHPCTTIPILSWAKALKFFSFNFMVDSNYFLKDFSLTHLQSMLDLHSNTLEKIALTSYTGGSTPDFRHFPKLRELHISHYEFFENHPKDAAFELAAPRLASISIDFDKEDQQCFVRQEYELTHDVWLQRFGRIYRSNVPKGGIRYIEVINVQDDEDDEEDDDDEDKGYHALKNTKAALEKMQISFAWPDAFESREDAIVEESEGSSST